MWELKGFWMCFRVVQLEQRHKYDWSVDIPLSKVGRYQLGDMTVSPLRVGMLGYSTNCVVW